jgi:hypothetical protein
MKIKSLRLQNFKRFTDLTLEGIPEGAKLVLLIGANGSGKSSVFDAFGFVASNIYAGFDDDVIVSSSRLKYYSKNDTGLAIRIDLMKGHFVSYETSGPFFVRNTHSAPISSTSFYGRTSFRQVPRLTRTSLGNMKFDIEKDDDRALAFIDREERFENDLEHLFGKLLKEFFRSDRDNSRIKRDVVDPINESLGRIFGGQNGTKLQLLELIPPLEGKTAEINFQKGESTFHYNLLSAGEKEVFNILVNLIARREYYQDTVYFFDEIDLHLNTQLQYSFLKEITENWIPENCQLWTASHSLGFIEYATEYEQACIIDFADLNFDKPQVLVPKSKDNFQVFEIAVSKNFIDKAVQGRKIIFSENKNTPFYNDLNIENTFFFVALDKNDVFHKMVNYQLFGLMDRDYLADEEMEDLETEYPSLYLLPYYSFENLIYHPDNMEEYFRMEGKEFDKAEYVNQVTKVKNNERDYIAAGIINARNSYPFYKENHNDKKLKAFRGDYRKVIDLLRSDDFETFYKVFPAKDYGKSVPVRQNISPADLAKTDWFRRKVEEVINKK